MKTFTAEVVWDIQATLGEGPSFDAARGRLMFVDIEQKKVHFYNLSDGATNSMEFDQRIGTIVPVEGEDSLLAAMQNGLYFVSTEDGKLTAISDPEQDKPNNRFNDGKCDANGRLWAGTMSTIGEKEVGSLYVLDNDLTVRRMAGNVTISNGIAWSLDNKTMYYIDTPTMRVVAYDYDADAGTIANPRTVVTIPDGEGAPDGMTSDSEGMLWVAQWGGYKVSRWNPATGERLAEVAVPSAHVTSCVFAGENLDELYITSARVGVSEDSLKEYPSSGSLFRVKPGVRGLPTHAFRRS